MDKPTTSVNWVGTREVAEAGDDPSVLVLGAMLQLFWKYSLSDLYCNFICKSLAYSEVMSKTLLVQA